jgi:hypothetical protein
LATNIHHFRRCAQRVCDAAGGARFSVWPARFELALQNTLRRGGAAAVARVRCAATRRLATLRSALRERDFMRFFKLCALLLVSRRSS